MALTHLEFTFSPAGDGLSPIDKEWSHTGVVGSGDMEVLIRRRKADKKVTAKVTTPVTGFDELWKKVLERFVEESRLCAVDLDINDNNATPFIAATRLRQALAEAKGGAEE